MGSSIDGLSIGSVDRQSNARAALTLAFTGDIAADPGLQVRVLDAATSADEVELLTAFITVTPAPTPGWVTGVSAEPGPGSLTVTWRPVDHADGYVVTWGRDVLEAASNRQQVDGRLTTRFTIDGLLGDTEYWGRWRPPATSLLTAHSRTDSRLQPCRPTRSVGHGP